MALRAPPRGAGVEVVEITLLPNPPLQPLRVPLETFGEYGDWVDYLAAHPSLPLALVVATTVALLERWGGDRHPVVDRTRLRGEEGLAIYHRAFSHYALHRTAAVEATAEGVLASATLSALRSGAFRACPFYPSPTSEVLVSHPSLRRAEALSLVEAHEGRAIRASLKDWRRASHWTREWAQWLHRCWKGKANPLLNPKSPSYVPILKATPDALEDSLRQRLKELTLEEG